MAKRPSIDKSVLAFGEPARIRDEPHKAFVRSLPCCVTLFPLETQAAHISKGTDACKGEKASDYFTIPLCVREHARQHQKGEITFWQPYGGYERAIQLAQDLYTVTGDIDAGKKLVWEFYFENRSET